MTQKPRMIILTGPSGSGKGTARSALLAESEYVVASADDVLMTLAAESGVSYQEAYAEHSSLAEATYASTLRQAISRAQDIIVDRTNLTENKRKNLILAGKRSGYEVVAMVPAFDVFSPEGEATLLDRAATRRDRGEPMPAGAILSQIAAYEMPTTQEGIDVVLTMPTGPNPPEAEDNGVRI